MDLKMNAMLVKRVLLLLFLCCSIAAKAQYSAFSPDRKTVVSLNMVKERNLDTKLLRAKRMKMSITADGKTILKNREIGLIVYSHGHRYSFGKADIVNSTSTISPIHLDADSDVRLAELGNRCNRLVIQSAAGIMLEILVFDEGVAYRFSVTGYDDEYKILDVCDVFPGDKANAILGTFTGDQVFPWRMMRYDESDKNQEKEPDEWQTLYPSNKVVSWRDALSSVSIGATFNWLTGKSWGGLSQSHGVYADFIYKHLYGGLSFTPCQQLLYIEWAKDFDPFTKVMGSVHSWDISARFGYNLPVQNGADVWCFAPYATATYLALRQHGNVHPLALPLTNKNHYLLGLGLKVQYMMRERISLGIGYEYQWFTGHKEPIGRNTLILTIGYGL